MFLCVIATHSAGPGSPWSLSCIPGSKRGGDYHSQCYIVFNRFLQGLALINGTQMITGLGVEALARAELIAKEADVVAAITLEALQGTTRAFDYGITFLYNYCGSDVIYNYSREKVFYCEAMSILLLQMCMLTSHTLDNRQ